MSEPTLLSPTELDERLERIGHGSSIYCPTWVKTLPCPGCHCLGAVKAHILALESQRDTAYEQGRREATAPWKMTIITAAIEAEREACAQLARGFGSKSCYEVSDAIRNRGTSDE